LLGASNALAARSEQIPGTGASFTSACTFSHDLMDDPIVFPDQPGASHMHDFFGNTSTDAFSTLDSLLGQATTCDRPEDTGAYWAPALLLDGTTVPPAIAAFYYRAGGKDYTTVQPPPAGLEMVAGDSHATAPQSSRIASWVCATDTGKVSGPDPGSIISQCNSNSIEVHINFPDCWDGQTLSDPSEAHVVYSARTGLAYPLRACPADHPVPIPALEFVVSYRLPLDGTLTLVSGTYSAHADFFNSWDPTTLSELVTSCINGVPPELIRPQPCRSPNAVFG